MTSGTQNLTKDSNGGETIPPLAKDSTVSLLRVLAILLVVAQHSTQLYFGDSRIIDPTLASPFYNLATHYIASFSMPLFVFISGYLYYVMRQERGKYTNYEGFVRSKFRRLIVPYYIFAFLYFFPSKLLLGIYKIDDIPNTLLTLATAGGQNVLWFLFMLFFVFSIFYLIENKIKNTSPYLTFGIFSLMSIYSGYFTTTLQVQTILQYMVFFYLGYYIRSNFASIKKYFVVLTAPLFLIHSLVFILTIRHSALSIFPIQQILILVDSTVGVLGLFTLANLIPARINIGIGKLRLFHLIDKNSLLIYLLHVPIILTFLYLFAPRIQHYSIIATASFVVGLSVSTLLATLITIFPYMRSLFYSSADLGVYNKSKR